MQRILRLSAPTFAIIAAVSLVSLTPLFQSGANAGPYGPYYYGGGYSPGYGRYSGYMYSPYGNGGYTYSAPRVYVYPSYRSYGFGNGFGTGATYNGLFPHSYGGSRFYGQPNYGYGGYSPYGYGGYGPYGY